MIHRHAPGRALLAACATAACVAAATATAADAPGAAPPVLGEIRLIRPAPDAVPVWSEAALRRLITGRRTGGPCDAPGIAAFLERRYRFLGYVPSITARCEDGALHLSIRESSHVIDTITFDAADLTGLGLRPDPAYREERRLYPVPEEMPRAALRALMKTRPGDLYNFERYRADRAALERLGFTIAFVPGVAEEGDYPRGAYLIQSLRPRAARRDDPRRENNYLGGSASYGPRTRAAIGADYQRSELFGRFDRLSVAPLYNAALGGTLSYSAPLMAAREDPRRLYDAAFDIYSDFRHNRLLQGIETDQRSTGASLRMGFRPAWIAAPHELRFETALRHQRVSFEAALPGEPEEGLTALRLAADWTYRHTERPPSFTFRLGATVDQALRAAGGDRRFLRPSLEAGLHTRHPAGVETDLRFVAGTLDRAVPSWEQWSLGGPATVRGFREDFRLGRHFSALQAELWFPLARPLESLPGPPGADPAPGLLPREPSAARLMKGALFADGGTVSGTADGRNAAIAGAGIGLRLLVPRRPLVIRIDYAWGLGGRGGDSFPYVALGYRF
jgi:hypothetical protein